MLGILRKLFSFPAFLGVLLLGAAFLACTHVDRTPGSRVFAEGDLWWHLVAGQQILETRTWPTVDRYSFTASGTRWIAYEWLAEVAMAAAERVASFQGLLFLLVGLAAAFFVLLYYYASLQSGDQPAGLEVHQSTRPVHS